MPPRPAAVRKKISQTQRKAFLKSVAEGYPAEALTHKKCSKCGLVKATKEFYRQKEKLKSGLIAVRPKSECKKCTGKALKAREKRLEAEGVDVKAYRSEIIARHYSKKANVERRRRTAREYQAVKRRKEGRRNYGPWKKYRDKSYGPSLPIEPIRILLGVILEEESREELARRVGVHPRRLYQLQHGVQASVALDLVDRILVSLGRHEDLDNMYPPEEEKRRGYEMLDPNGLLQGDLT